MDVDNTVKVALSAAIARVGSQRAFAAAVGLSATSPGKYLGLTAHRPTVTIPHQTYERLYPYIKPDLPAGDPRYLPLSMRGPGLAVTATYPVPAYSLREAAEPYNTDNRTLRLSEYERVLVLAFRRLPAEERAHYLTLVCAAAKISDKKERALPVAAPA